MVNISTVSHKQFYLNKNNDGWGSEEGDFIGWENHASTWRYRLHRYSFTLPTIDNGVSIVNFKTITINFPHRNYGYGVFDGATGPSEFYALISSSDRLTNNDINNNTSNARKLIFSSSYPIQPYALTFDVSALGLNPGGTYYLFIHPKQCVIGQDYWQGRTWTSSATGFSISFETECFTNCTAPTSGRVDKTIMAVGGKVTLDWSGAQGGNGNPIAGYRIYYELNRWPSTSSNYWDSTSTTSSSPALGQESYRGSYYYFSVQTLGTQANFNSGLMNLGKVKINSLPYFSSSSISITVPSTGGYVSIPAASDPDGQSITYWQDGASSPFTGQLFFSAAGSYKVWAHDGLEYGGPYTINVTRNTKPSVSYIDSSEKKVANGARNYVISPNLTITSSKAGTLYIQLESQNKTLQTNQYSITNRLVFKDTKVQSTLASLYANKDLSYGYKIWMNDGIENSNIITANFKLPASPICTLNTFYNTAKLQFNKDETATSYSIEAKNGNNNVIASSTYVDGDEPYFNIKFNNLCTSESSISFTLKASNDQLTKVTTFTKTAGIMPSFNQKATWGTTKIFPFSANGTVQITVPALFPKTYSSYNITNAQLVLTRNNVKKSIAVTIGGDQDTTRIVLDQSSIFSDSDFNNNLWGLKLTSGWRGEYTLGSTLVLTNSSDATFEITFSNELILSFNRVGSIASAIPILANPYTNEYNESIAFKIQEGMKLKFKLVTHIYSYEQIRLNFEYSLDNQTFYSLHSEDRTPTNYGSKKDVPGINNIEITFSRLFPQIASSSRVYWRITITGKTTSLSTTYKFQQDALPHTNIKDFYITAGKVVKTDNNNRQIILTYDGDVPSGSEFSLIDSDNLGFIYLSSSGKNITFSTIKDTFPTILTIQLKARTYVKQGQQNNPYFQTEYETITPAYAIFIDAPTVSYRPNCIGINTSSPEVVDGAKAVLVISPTEDRNSLIINSAANQNFEIKAITSANLINMVIDCGTW